MFVFFVFFFFEKKFCKKDFQLFSKIFSQIFVDFDQKQLIVRSFSKLKKNSQNEKYGSIAPVKQGFLFSWPNLQSFKMMLN